MHGCTQGGSQGCYYFYSSCGNLARRKSLIQNIGRFLQADPFIQAPKNQQNYNRYSYVLNNPLNFTDPSGYNFLSNIYSGLLEKSGIADFQRSLMRNSELNSITHLLIATAGGEWASAFFSFEQSYVATGSLNRALGAGAIVIASAMAHEYVGSTFALSTTDGRISNAIGNAFVGGITADLQGGTESLLLHFLSTYIPCKQVRTRLRLSRVFSRTKILYQRYRRQSKRQQRDSKPRLSHAKNLQSRPSIRRSSHRRHRLGDQRWQVCQWRHEWRFCAVV